MNIWKKSEKPNIQFPNQDMRVLIQPILVYHVQTLVKKELSTNSDSHYEKSEKLNEPILRM